MSGSLRARIFWTKESVASGYATATGRSNRGRMALGSLDDEVSPILSSSNSSSSPGCTAVEEGEASIDAFLVVVLAEEESTGTEGREGGARGGREWMEAAG